jgi:mannosylglycoprotein endo-beta-mannosidase
MQTQDIDVGQLTANFGGTIVQLPTKYLGLPLHIGKTKRVDEQALVDKIGARLPGWKGRLLTRAGRLALVNSVLTSIPVYYMTSFPLSKWAIKKIDRIRRNFLWKGKDDPRRGHCPVNWIRACRAKRMGGLGIKELASFNRALRLRWPWFKWTDPTKPWSDMDIRLTEGERELFKLCTTITIGNGERTRFWKDRWLQGQAPKDIAPECFRLTWRKNHSVAAALPTGRWMRGLQRLSSADGMQQFVQLWIQLNQVQLNNDPDTLRWRFTADGRYSTRSAYNIQFTGTVADGNWKLIWKAKVENKCRFFTWLLIQARLPTADRLLRHCRQASASTLCTLCRTRHESHLHMAAKCSYVKTVWQTIAPSFQIQIPPFNPRSLRKWWLLVLQQGVTDRANHMQVIIYTLWNIWKERCRRVFQNVAVPADRLAHSIKQDIMAYRQANQAIE